MIASSTEARERVTAKAKEIYEATGAAADPWIVAENVAQELIEAERQHRDELRKVYHQIAENVEAR